jgi:hypothetical protein
MVFILKNVMIKIKNQHIYVDNDLCYYNKIAIDM